jgi:DNA-binding YbaB/EbfC family protein
MPPQPNMQQMMKQVQKMQADMMAAQESLKDERVEASAGGGMVKVVATGELAIESITIDPAAVDPDDVEMLQDTVLAAVNEALRSAQELAASKMGNVTGGLGGPGGGMVKVVATGELAIESITIDPAAVDPEDVEMLQDTVLAAVNEALRSAQELAASKMGNVTGGLGGPGGGLGGLGLPGL